MFESLSASRSPSLRPRLSWLTSLLTHLTLVGIGVVLTRGVASARHTTSTTRVPLVFTTAIAPSAGVPASPTGVVPHTPTAPSAIPMSLSLPSIKIPVAPVQLPEPGSGGDRTTPGRPNPGAVPMLHLPLLHAPVWGDSLAVDVPATPLAGPHPDYPAALRAAGIEGAVRLRFVVTASGLVDSLSVRLLHSSNPAFVPSAVAAILAWRFRPARRRGLPVAQQVEQMVRFRLEP